jgi:hypothetical protein
MLVSSFLDLSWQLDFVDKNRQKRGEKRVVEVGVVAAAVVVGQQ